MKQYCRYCVNMVYGDSCYCEIKKQCLSYDSCKRANKCKSFEINPIDALGENPKGYAPRKNKRLDQISIESEDEKRMTNYERIKSMSVEEMAEFMGQHIDHYRAPYEVKVIFENSIDNNTGKGLTWIKAFEEWLNEEVER